MLIKDLQDKLYILQQNYAAIKIQKWWLSLPICTKCNSKINVLYLNLCDICFYDKFIFK
jgi:hypothetical protein